MQADKSEDQILRGQKKVSSLKKKKKKNSGAKI